MCPECSGDLTGLAYCACGWNTPAYRSAHAAEAYANAGSWIPDAVRELARQDIRRYEDWLHEQEMRARWPRAYTPLGQLLMRG